MLHSNRVGGYHFHADSLHTVLTDQQSLNRRVDQPASPDASRARCRHIQIDDLKGARTANRHKERELTAKVAVLHAHILDEQIG